MVAVPASQPECVACRKGRDGFLARHVCPACGKPQPLGAGETYFEAFGVDARFAQEPALLQKRFYEISRALHPDRFTTAAAESKRRSLERMSFVNEAFKTLKNRDELREYVLRLEKVEKPAVQAPVELAEKWFEIQDALTEDPERAVAMVGAFGEELSAVKKGYESSIDELERDLDKQGFGRNGLERLARKVQERNYLISMERDVARIRQKVAS